MAPRPISTRRVRAPSRASRQNRPRRLPRSRPAARLVDGRTFRRRGTLPVIPRDAPRGAGPVAAREIDRSRSAT
ncbi:MAG: hypothetical protein ACK55I_49955, partial [bacterium]